MKSTILLFSLMGFLPLTCVNAGHEENKGLQEKIHHPKSKEHILPKNWPWRGVSFQSESSDSTDINYLAGIGVNFVRIELKAPVRARREKTDGHTAFYRELEWAESILNAVKKNNMTSVVAFNFVVIDPESKITDKSMEFWTDPMYKDSTIHMLETIVKRFRYRGDELSCYEVIGEPAVRLPGKKGPSVPPGLEKFFLRVLNTIRKHDQERWMLVSPGPWGKPTNYIQFKPFNLNDNKIIYGAHMYLPDEFTHQGIKGRERGAVYPGVINGIVWNRTTIENRFLHLKKFEKTYNYPVYIGEFQAARWSIGADAWVKDVISVLDSYNWSWSMFAYEAGTEAWDAFYDVEDRSKPQADWTIKYTGKSTALWQYMISEFTKNKNRKRADE